jgi:hypothetical protein
MSTTIQNRNPALAGTSLPVLPSKDTGVTARVIQLFQPAQDRQLVVRRVLLSALICYLLSGAAAWLLLPAIAGNVQNSRRAVELSVLYIAFVTALAAVAGELQLRRFRKLLPIPRRTILFFLLNGALWMTPLAVLCRSGGVQAMLAAAAFSFASALLLGSLVSRLEPDEEPADAYNLLAFTAPVCVAYVGIAAAISGYKLIAVLLIAASCFSLGWMAQRNGRQPQQQPNDVVSRFWKQALWATFITFIALLPSFRRFDAAAYGAQLLDRHTEDPKLGQMQAGVILLAKPKSAVLLELPRKTDFRTQAKQPSFRLASIPFSGQYWFFRPPRRRPPPGSLTEQGDPTTLTMTLEDFGVLRMQAQQSIGRSLDVNCCRSIDVVLKGKDEEPESVLLELILVDSSRSEHNIQTLGSQLLASETAVIHFPIPRNSAVRSFDELLVSFHLEWPHSRRSATVAIERFDLVP